MNRKFGGGKQPMGTPSTGWSCFVVVASLLASASVVHNIYKPNLSLPHVEIVNGDKQCFRRRCLAPRQCFRRA